MNIRLQKKILGIHFFKKKIRKDEIDTLVVASGKECGILVHRC